MRLHLIYIVLALPLLAFSPGHNQEKVDLSTPESAYAAFLDALKEEKLQLEVVVTPTGFHSLVQVVENAVEIDDVAGLGTELEASSVEWHEITSDIYFLEAISKHYTHKLEFTLEESGWMLYHWQLGAGVDAHAGIDQ